MGNFLYKLLYCLPRLPVFFKFSTLRYPDHIRRSQDITLFVPLESANGPGMLHFMDRPADGGPFCSFGSLYGTEHYVCGIVGIDGIGARLSIARLVGSQKVLCASKTLRIRTKGQVAPFRGRSGDLNKFLINHPITAHKGDVDAKLPGLFYDEPSLRIDTAEIEEFRPLPFQCSKDGPEVFVFLADAVIVNHRNPVAQGLHKLTCQPLTIRRLVVKDGHLFKLQHVSDKRCRHKTLLIIPSTDTKDI